MKALMIVAVASKPACASTTLLSLAPGAAPDRQMIEAGHIAESRHGLGPIGRAIGDDGGLHVEGGYVHAVKERRARTDQLREHQPGQAFGVAQRQRAGNGDRPAAARVG